MQGSLAMSNLDRNSLGVAQVSVFAVFQPLVMIACGLRVWARRIAGVELAVNDYFILSALVGNIDMIPAIEPC